MTQKAKKLSLELFIIFIACYLLRIVEYFILRTDQSFWNEAFIHKLLGIGILFAAMRFYQLKAEQIGFTKKNRAKHFLWGFGLELFVFLFAYLAEILFLISQGHFRGLGLYVTAYSLTGNVGRQDGLIFFLICIVGNLINVLMEEGIFRGLFQTLWSRVFSVRKAILYSSILFGFWHTLAPFRSFLDGDLSEVGLLVNVLILFITTFLVGLQFALMDLLTHDLYMAMGAHFVNNTLVNILHVLSNKGVDPFMTLRITIAQTFSFIVLLFWFQWRKRKESQS